MQKETRETTREPSPYIIRNFNDRATQWLLEDPAYLKDLLRLLAPALAEKLDFTRAVRVNRSLVSDDLLLGENDIIYRLPFLSGEAELQIVLFTEQQSRPDRLMLLRFLDYGCGYWKGELRASRDAGLPRNEWRLSLIVPILYYTGTDRWDGDDVRLSELMDLPEELEEFAPHWKTLRLDLSRTPPERLTEELSALGWALRVWQAQRAPLSELQALIEQAMAAIEGLPQDQAGQWVRCAWFLLQLVYHRRKREESGPLVQRIIDRAHGSKFYEQEEQAMSVEEFVSYADELKLEGKLEGKAEGEISGERRLVFRQGTAKFGEPSEAIRARIETVNSLEALEELGLRVLTAQSWEELTDGIPAKSA